MQQEAKLDRRATRRTAALLIAGGVTFVAGTFFLPDALANLYEADTISQKYAAVAAHEGAYRWANIAVAIAAVLAAIGIVGVGALGRAPSGYEKVALAGFALAAVGWVVESALRATVVIGRAADLAAGKTMTGTALTDGAIEGGSWFVLPSLVGAVTLLTLAAMWMRRGVIGRPTAAALGIAAVAGAVFVRSDPIAIAFIPPFPFIIGFLPAGIALVWRSRASRSRGEPLKSPTRSTNSSIQ